MKVQLAEAREEIASLGLQRDVSKKGERSKAARKPPSASTKLIAASR
jgi:hypothetical protein